MKGMKGLVLLGSLAVVVALILFSKTYATTPPPAGVCIADVVANPRVIGLRGSSTVTAKVVICSTEHPYPGASAVFTIQHGQGSLSRWSAVADQFGNASVGFSASDRPGDVRIKACGYPTGLGSPGLTLCKDVHILVRR